MKTSLSSYNIQEIYVLTPNEVKNDLSINDIALILDFAESFYEQSVHTLSYEKDISLKIIQFIKISAQIEGVELTKKQIEEVLKAEIQYWTENSFVFDDLDEWTEDFSQDYDRYL